MPLEIFGFARYNANLYYFVESISDNLKLSMSNIIHSVKIQGFHLSVRVYMVDCIVNKSVNCEIKLRAWYVSCAVRLYIERVRQGGEGSTSRFGGYKMNK